MRNDRFIHDNLQQLVGKPLNLIYRSCELVGFGFGNVNEIIVSGRIRSMPEYALHVMCPFRILQKGQIIIGSSDLFIRPDGIDGYVNLDEKDSCLFDYRLKELAIPYDSNIVTALDISPIGDLILSLKQFQIEVLPTSSTNDEQWRFLVPPSEGRQIICNGKGLWRDGE